MTSKKEIINNNDRCIHCGHYYSPDELTEMDYYDCGIPENRVYICYYCSSDMEKESN